MRAFTLASLASSALLVAAHTDCTAVDAAVIQHDGFSRGLEEVQNGGKIMLPPPLV